MATAKKVAVKKVAAVAAPVVQAKPVGFRVNQAARVKGGAYGQLVGIVQAISDDGTRAQLLIQGVNAGDKVDALEWFGADDLEQNQ